MCLFVSYRTLRRQHGIGRSKGPWAIDSGGFTEITRHGRWTFPADRYAEDLCRYAMRDFRRGHLMCAAPMDWMCERAVRAGGRLPSGEVAVGTGLSVRAHQDRTIASVVELRGLLADHDRRLAAARTPLVIPVIQGDALDDCLAHVAMYVEAGFDLRSEPVVGVGSVCRRQDTDEILALMRELRSEGLRLHAFGVSTRGLSRLAPLLRSCDRMAWSLAARKEAAPISRDCTHRRCVTCPHYAMRWRQILLERLRADLRSPAVPVVACGGR